LTIRTAKGIEPTPFSLFVANMIKLRPSDKVAIDAGAGSGILAIALARLGVPRVIGVERDVQACNIFRDNIRANGVESQVEIINGDIREYKPGRVASLVVANPPTIPEHPDLPTFVSGGGPNGMTFLRLLLDRSRGWLRSQGDLQFVVSSLVDQSELRTVAAGYGWNLTAQGSELVPLRAFYNLAYGLQANGRLQLPGAQADDGRVFHQNEIITVYHARQPPEPA
jgi:methylase of polypeptide subunit release factors